MKSGFAGLMDGFDFIEREALDFIRARSDFFVALPRFHFLQLSVPLTRNVKRGCAS